MGERTFRILSNINPRWLERALTELANTCTDLKIESFKTMHAHYAGDSPDDNHIIYIVLVSCNI